MISLKYFRHKIALSMMFFGTFLSISFCILLFIGLNKSDDNIRESLLASHSERLTQYHSETGRFWARNQLTGIDVLVQGRDSIPARFESISPGYFEEGEEELYVFSSIMGSAENDDQLRVFLVHNGTRTEWFEQYEPLINILLVVVTICVSLIGAVTGIILSRRLAEPLQLLTERIKSTNPAAPSFMSLERNDEFGEISDAFATTLQRIAAVMEREKQFSSYASHELRTPVAIINSSINLWRACEKETDPEKAQEIRQRAMTRINAAAAQMEDVIRTFLILGKEQETENPGPPADVSKLLDELIEKYQELHGFQHILIEKDYIDSGKQVTNPRAVELVLSNVLRNAFGYCASTIHIELTATQLTFVNDIDALRIKNADHFGFGIKIIEDLCKALDWMVEYNELDESKFRMRFKFR